MPRIAKDLSGSTFGRWLVLSRAPNKPGDVVAWRCRCDPARGGCGTEKVVAVGTLRDGRSRSCRRCAAVRFHQANPMIRVLAVAGHQRRRPMTCATCGAPFEGVGRQRYCSQPCRPSVRCRRRPKVPSAAL